jgi:two-component system, NtrC family, response regulator AtoC
LSSKAYQAWFFSVFAQEEFVMKLPAQFSVFLVEDNEFYALMLDQGIREQLNYRVIPFVSGEACIENLYLDPDVVILDFSLTGMNGLDTLKEIKKRKPELPVVIVSGQDDVGIVTELIKAGAFRYIRKNADTCERLLEAMEELQEMLEG